MRRICLLISLLLCALGVTAAVPRFSIQGGVYTNDLIVELSAAPPGIIRLTLDGSEPSATSEAYSKALTVTNSTLVRAKVFDGKTPIGPAVSQTYILLDSDLWDFSSDLPLVIINTFGQGISREKAPVSVRFTGPGPDGRSVLGGAANFESRATLKIRGTSSMQFPKHSFSLKTKDENGAKLNGAILGMPEDSEWILYAPYPDKTLMRDALAYDLSRQMGHYSPRTRFVEVFASRSERKLTRGAYLGVYVFEERIKRSKERVNIAKLKPSDNDEPAITGGYIFKKDHEKRPGGFWTSEGIHFYYVEPKEESLTPQQKRWLTGYLNKFEQALNSEDFKDPKRGYAAYIDPESFIDLHWIVELSKNIDGYRLSNYLHKDRGGKLKMEPIWDWNLSFGNANYLEGWLPEGWYWPHVREGEYPWFKRLFADPDFKQRYIDRWAQLRTNQFAVSNILGKVDAMAAELEEAQRRNFKRWRILHQSVWPNWYVGESYRAEVTWMKQWIEQRVAWIDGQFLPQPSVAWEQGTQSNRLARLKASKGQIYYTLDGTDPRASGGAVRTGAKIYEEPLSIGEGVRLCARARLRNSWSAPLVAAVPRKL